MKNSLTPSSASAGAVAPATSPVAVSASKTPPVKPAQPQVQRVPPASADKTKAAPAAKNEFKKAAVALDETAKKPWWKFWGGTTAPKVVAAEVKPVAAAAKEIVSEVVKPVEKKLTEKEDMMERHEALISSVNDICKSIEKSSARPVEVKATDFIQPIPVENLDAIAKSQEAVSGALDKVAGRLDAVKDRDEVMLNSLSKVDGSLVSLTSVSEKSISALDGVKAILTQVGGAMTTMQSEIKSSDKRYEELCKKVQKSETEHSEKVQSLQKKTLGVNVLLGLGLIGSLIAVAVKMGA